MKTKVCHSIPVCLILLSCSAFAVGGAYSFWALNYGPMWSNYARVVDGKTMDRNCPVNICISDEGYCKKTVYCSIVGINTRITIPDDVKLITPAGNVVGDEICVGDSFKVVKGANKGEYWDDGGDMDSPQVYWVDDVEALAAKLVSQHKSSSTAKIGGTPVGDGYVDPLTGIPVYNKQLMSSSIQNDILEHFKITGNLVCSLKGDAPTTGGVLAKEGEYYRATSPGTASFNAAYPVECMYYYYGGICDPSDSMCGGSNSFCLYQVPMFPNMDGNGLSGLLDVGSISLSRTIKVTQAGSAKAEFEVAGLDDVRFGEQNNLRILVENVGNVSMSVKAISSKSPYKFISCDVSSIAPGSRAECILQVTPTASTGLDVSVSYEYSSCGRRQTGVISKTLLGTATVMPHAAYQVYGIEVKGDCKNSYYSCNAPGDTMLSVGYKCMKQSNYHTPAAGRVDLEYDLSSLDPNARIAAASLKIRPSAVNRPQKISVYVYSYSLGPVSCSAGGDICTQPYCMECKPLYDIMGDPVASADVNSAQIYSLDVTDYVRAALGSDSKALSFQLRGVENLWDSQGASQCESEGYWTNQDILIPSSGAGAPVLEVALK